MKLLLILAALGCAPLPALITDAQVRAVLAPEQAEAGTRCAARLNGHVRAARAAGVALFLRGLAQPARPHHAPPVSKAATAPSSASAPGAPLWAR